MTGASSGTTGSGDVGLPAGLDRSGWAGVAGARCAGTDTWVYAAQNSGARVVVCRDGGTGDLYYRALADEGALEITTGITGGAAADGYYVVPYPPSEIVIDGTVLTIYNADGSVWGVEAFPRYWHAD